MCYHFLENEVNKVMLFYIYLYLYIYIYIYTNDNSYIRI